MLAPGLKFSKLPDSQLPRTACSNLAVAKRVRADEQNNSRLTRARAWHNDGAGSHGRGNASKLKSARKYDEN